MSWLNDLIGTIELFKREIYTSPTGQAYMTRYIVIGCKLFCIYIHKFAGDDWTRAPHSHPRRFISLILRGDYTEISYPNPFVRWDAVYTKYQVGDVNYIGLDTVHRIVKVRVPTWTLCLGGRVVTDWGFYDIQPASRPQDDYITFIPSKKWIAENYKVKGEQHNG